MTAALLAQYTGDTPSTTHTITFDRASAVGSDVIVIALAAAVISPLRLDAEQIAAPADWVVDYSYVDSDAMKILRLPGGKNTGISSVQLGLNGPRKLVAAVFEDHVASVAYSGFGTSTGSFGAGGTAIDTGPHTFTSTGTAYAVFPTTTGAFNPAPDGRAVSLDKGFSLLAQCATSYTSNLESEWLAVGAKSPATLASEAVTATLSPPSTTVSSGPFGIARPGIIAYAPRTPSDLQPPTVTSRVPLPGATDVSASATVTVGFSEPVVSASVVLRRGGTVVPSGVTGTGASRLLTPLSPLVAGAVHTVEVSGATDAADNVQVGTDSWTFTTAAAPTGAGGGLKLSDGTAWHAAGTAGATTAYVDAGDAANSAETQAVADELALVEGALQDVKVWAGDPTPLHVNSTLSEWLSDLADEVHHLSARPAFSLDGILHVDLYNGFARVFSNTPELEIGGEKWVEFELATTPAPGGTIPPGTNAVASSAGALVRAGGVQGPVVGETGGAVSQMALANYISQNRICRVLYDLSNPVRPTLTILETLDAIPTGSSALHLGALYDVSAPANTPAGKVLGTVAEGSWGPVDPPAGGGGGLPSGTLTGQMIFWNGTSWTVAATADVLTASRFKPHSGAAFRIMDDSSVVGFRLNSSGAVFFSDTTIANGGKGVIGIANATTVPTSSPTNASLLYVEGGVLTVRNASATASPVATNSYVDSRTPQTIVLGPTDPVPGGTPSGTVIVRREV